MNIIITGAGKGMGFELVKWFATSGKHNIIAIVRNEGAIENLMNITTSNECFIFPLCEDLLETNAADHLISFINSKKIGIDILINNAGFMIKKPVNELSDKDFDNLFDTNVKTPFRLVRSLLPCFNKDAHIVNIGSMGGFQGSMKFTGLSLYSASKGALAILSECLAEELKERNIYVNCLALGAVQTEMLENTFPGYKAPVSALEMAKFIGEFAINGHQFVNGKIIPVSVTTP
jgi:short-subunit dehydrogenase